MFETRDLVPADGGDTAHDRRDRDRRNEPGIVVVNVACGGVVNEPAMIDAPQERPDKRRRARRVRG
jgi:hypothetical protein